MERPAAQLDLSSYPTRPTQLIRSSSGWSALNFAEVWQFRELLLTFAGRDVRVRYKQTALGALWVVFQPLMAAGIFSFIFTRIANLEAPEGYPYFLLTFAGLLGWNAFAGVLTRSSSALVGNAALVSKIYFPRLILPLSAVLTVLVDFLVTLGLLAALLAVFWHFPGWNVLLLPVCLALMWVLALGIGLCVSAIAVSYRDALHILPVLTQFLMWVSAVLFSMRAVDEPYRSYFYINPLVSLIETFRWSVLGGTPPRWESLAYAAAVSAAVFVCGAFAFRRMERRFADVI